MTSLSGRFASLWLVVALLAAISFAACSDSDASNGSPTATSSPSTTATSVPDTPQEPAFEGGRDTVEGSLGDRNGAPPPLGTLVDVRAAEHDDYDRIAFEFNGPPPDYRVEYVDDPTECGSGEQVTVQGGAYLSVSFNPVNAHTDAGQPTLAFQSIGPGLAAIAEAVQSCDFEAVVTWIVGTSEAADFRVAELADPPRLAIDVAHP